MRSRPRRPPALPEAWEELLADLLKTPEAEAESGASCSELSEGDGDSENSSGSGGSAASLTHRWTSFFRKEKRRAKRLQRQEDQEKAERDEEEQAATRRRWETEADPLSVTQLVKLTRRLRSLRGGGRHDQRTRRFPGEALVIVANDPLASNFDIAYTATAASEQARSSHR